MWLFSNICNLSCGTSTDLDNKSTFKDWSTLFCLHWEMKGHWSRVIKRFTRDQCPFIFQCKRIKCTLILIFMLKWQITPKKSKKSMSICRSRDRCLSLENICHRFLMLHRRRMPWDCKYLKMKVLIDYFIAEHKCMNWSNLLFALRTIVKRF